MNCFSLSKCAQDMANRRRHRRECTAVLCPGNNFQGEELGCPDDSSKIAYATQSRTAMSKLVILASTLLVGALLVATPSVATRVNEQTFGMERAGEDEVTVGERHTGNFRVERHLKGSEPHGMMMTESDVCSSLSINGLDGCPSWRDTRIPFHVLRIKRDLLRQVLDVLEDPASCGWECDAQEPLLLVQKLTYDEADAAMGAFWPEYVGVMTDSGGWSPEVGGMNRWIGRYYEEVLMRQRPLLIYVHGDDVCALEVELLREARERLHVDPGHIDWSSEDFDVPVVLITVGWDPSGDPTHQNQGRGRDPSCALRLLDSDRVKTWLTSHEQQGTVPHEKLKHMPIGFGGLSTRNGLPQQQYIDAARAQLERMEECAFSHSGSFDLLFQCSAVDAGERKKIWNSMQDKESDDSPVPINRYPLPPADTTVAAAAGLFALSPPGTGPDCFRHYEMITAGNIVLIPESRSMRTFMGDLPAFFFGSEDRPWGELTCDQLLAMANMVDGVLRLQKKGLGSGFAFQKLTHGYWRRYVRREVLAAGGFSPDAPYVERSREQLALPDWKTFNHVGCFSGGQGENRKSAEPGSPESCAKSCSEHGKGRGFFGITRAGSCWCGDSIGQAISQEHCDLPADTKCDRRSGLSCSEVEKASTIYVFGPEKKLESEYFGCFPRYHRILYHKELELRSCTPKLCQAYCASHRYPFFSIHRSSWCHCGMFVERTGTSLREPAWRDEAVPADADGHFSNTSHAGHPWPGSYVGNPDYKCQSTCAGNKSLLGCGGSSEWDVYKMTEPCVLYGDC